MIRTGLVSVTFRKLSPSEIVRLAVTAGVDGIEWGGDVHVPPSEPARAAEVRQMTEASGLRVAAYGSYYRVGHEGEEGNAFLPVLKAAVGLGAPTIRVWAGRIGSAEAGPEGWEQAIADSRRIADLAAQEGIRIAYEFHSRTLTDTPESARSLLEQGGHPNVSSYWQPPVGEDTETCLRGLRMIQPWLTNLHIYHFVGAEQRALEEGREAWRRYFDVAREDGADRYALIEFVRGETPAQFLADAVVLKALLPERA
jgi:sugar phosphate isomerase/epimerase